MCFTPSLLCRDGLERVELPDGASLADLKHAIKENLGVPLEDILLSTDPKLVRSLPFNSLFFLLMNIFLFFIIAATLQNSKYIYAFVSHHTAHYQR